MSDSTYFAPGIFRPRGLMRQHSGNMGARFRGVVAQEFDNFTVASQLVQDAGNVLKCDASVLPQHALDRCIRRYLNESELSWRLRLSKSNQIHQTAGTAWGILRQLRIMLLPKGRPRLRHVTTSGDGAMSQWYTLAPGTGDIDYFETNPYDRPLDPEFSRYLAKPGNWLWDAGASSGEWSRFWLLIYTSGVASPPPDWDGTGEWDSGVDYWDGYLTSDDVAGIAEMATEWKFAGSQLAGIFLVHDDSLFDPTGSGAGYPDGTWNLDFNRVGGVSYAYER